MASTYSPNLRLELIGTGEQQGTWGITTNTNLGTLIEEAIGGYVSVAVTDGADTTLTTANGSADQARNMTINLTGTLTAARNVICPAIEKVYIVKNATTGGYSITFKVTGQTGVIIPNGQTMLVYVDGTDARQATPTILIAGSGDGTASAASGTIRGANKTGTNAAGENLIIAAGNGTGTGGSGSVKIQTAPAGASGATADTLTDRIVVNKLGEVGVPTIVSGYNLAVDYGFYINSGLNVTPGAGWGGQFTILGNGYAGGVSFDANGMWIGHNASNRTIYLTTNNTAQVVVGGNGAVGIGADPGATNSFYVRKNITGATTAISANIGGTVQSDVTADARGVMTFIATAASSFTLTSLSHFFAVQSTIGAGSTVTNQFGFRANSSLVGATNNYAFYAENTAAITSGKTSYAFYTSTNIATGGGTTYAFYSAGTAPSTFVGAIGLGGNALTTANLYVSRNISGATTAYGIYNRSEIQSDVTAAAVGVFSNLYTAAASFTLTTLYHFGATQNTLGASSAVTTQAGYYAYGTLVGATTNYSFHAANTEAITSGKTSYGFYSAINIASGGGETWAFYGAGTAPSLFAGSVTIGAAPTNDNVNFFVNKAVTGLAATSYGSVFQGLVKSDVTGSAIGILAQFGTVAASFTLTNLYQFRAAQSAFGASSSVTTQIGFYSDTTLIGATSNFGFYAGNTAAVTSGKTAYGFSTNMNVATGGGTTWAYYAQGTAWSKFSGPIVQEDVSWGNAPAPTSKTTTTTLTGAELKTQIIVTGQAANIDLTFPTGTNIDAAFSGLPSITGVGFDLHVINTGLGGTTTMLTNTGVTIVGSSTIANFESGHFRLRRTASNTYIAYRIA